MSRHDPFDGIYDDDDEQTSREAGTEAGADAGAHTAGEPEGFGKTELARMDKADLQAAASERGLDSSGTRADLIERLEEWQTAR